MPKHYVYRGINRTKGEVYHGISVDPDGRKDGSHCKGGTKTLQHWDCSQDKIRWTIHSYYMSQKKASSVAHDLEKTYQHYKGFKNIQTSGK